MSIKGRTLFLVVDVLALLGVIPFSVLAALEPDTTGYIIGQIICAVLILGSVFALRRRQV